MASRLQLGGWECACCPLVWGLGSGGGRRPAQGIQPKTLRVPPDCAIQRRFSSGLRVFSCEARLQTPRQTKHKTDERAVSSCDARCVTRA